MTPRRTQMAIEAAKLKVAIARHKGTSVEPWIEELANASAEDHGDASSADSPAAEDPPPRDTVIQLPDVVDVRESSGRPRSRE